MVRWVRVVASVIGLCFFWGAGHAALSQDRLVISTLEGSKNGQIAMRILTRAYEKIGIDVDVMLETGTRSLVLSSTGVTDGEAQRIKAVGERYPTLLRVDVPLFKLETVLFSKDPEIPNVSREELSKLTVGHARGGVHVEIFTEGFENVWVTNSHEAMFRMLADDRLDAVISNSITDTHAARRFGIDNIYVRAAVRRQKTLPFPA